MNGRTEKGDHTDARGIEVLRVEEREYVRCCVEM